jgi:hypothetical protein
MSLNAFNKQKTWPFRVIAGVTFVIGVATLLACNHILSNLPSSGKELTSNGVEVLLRGTRMFVGRAVPMTAGWMIFVSIALLKRPKRNE